MASVLKRLKYLIRSRSPGFVADHYAKFVPGRVAQLRWHDRTIHYRPGTSDTGVIHSILLKSGQKDEYAPPKEFTVPRERVATVLDIGANIGTSSVYFARIFPNAQIYAFEPMPENFELLRMNSAGEPRIHPVNCALGASDGEVEILASDSATNFGGFSLHAAGSDASKKQRVPMRNAQAQMDALGITSVDVIKIDTEGAEWEILTALSPELLGAAKLIMGELHGNRDFALLEHLSARFHVGARKGIRNRLFNFYAVNRSV